MSDVIHGRFLSIGFKSGQAALFFDGFYTNKLTYGDHRLIWGSIFKSISKIPSVNATFHSPKYCTMQGPGVQGSKPRLAVWI